MRKLVIETSGHQTYIKIPWLKAFFENVHASDVPACEKVYLTDYFDYMRLSEILELAQRCRVVLSFTRDYFEIEVLSRLGFRVTKRAGETLVMESPIPTPAVMISDCGSDLSPNVELQDETLVPAGV